MPGEVVSNTGSNARARRPLRKEQFRPDTERPLLLCGRSMGIVHLLFFPAILSLLYFNPLNGLHSPPPYHNTGAALLPLWVKCVSAERGHGSKSRVHFLGYSLFRVWVTVWVRQLTHILTHTFFSVFITKKHRKPKFSMLFGAAGQIRTADLILTKAPI